MCSNYERVNQKEFPAENISAGRFCLGGGEFLVASFFKLDLFYSRSAAPYNPISPTAFLSKKIDLNKRIPYSTH